MNRKNLFQITLAATAAIATAGVFAVAPAIGQSPELEPRQIRVVWTEDPAHQATISWTTTSAGSDHTFHLDTVPRMGEVATYATSTQVTRNGAYVEDGPYFHHITVDGLEPATEYFFVVETDGNVSDELFFRTAHQDSRPFKFIYGGDSRSGHTDRRSMNRRISDLHSADPEIVALVHGGDYINWANTWSQWSDWLDDHELTFTEDGEVLPIIPAKGNHEGRGVVYNRVFGAPGGSADTNWFYTEIGDLSLITLDTEVSMAGHQRDWLQERLEQGRESKWLVVNYHRPAFPAVKSPSGAREHWVPLFEQYDVDLVCESDGHTLKRTPPIRGERIDFTGVTYVGEGGLGVPQRTPKTDRWYLQAPGMAVSAHHVQVISFEEDLLRYRAVLMDGTIADEVTILPREQRLSDQIRPTMASAPTRTHIEVAFSHPFVARSATAGSWEIEPPLDIHRVVAGPEIDAVLQLVNEATFEELDDEVPLDRRAAANIVAFRDGPDGVADTADDRTFETWEQLDEIFFVGESALSRLSEYAIADSDNPRNEVTLVVDQLEKSQTYRLLLPAVEGEDGSEVPPDTTLTFLIDDPADSIADGGVGEGDDVACSTVAPGSVPASGFLLLGALLFRRRSRKERRLAK